MMNYSLFFLISAAISPSALSTDNYRLLSQLHAENTYVRPVPDKLLSFDPRDVNDLFTYAAVFQIHAALFILGPNTVPKPYLVKHFEVSSDQKTYSFELWDRKFHDGSAVTSREVVDSIESALKKHVTNSDFFQKIEGYDDLIHGKVAHLKGLRSEKSPREFSIKLTSPDPELIFKLTDIRFAITKNSSDRAERPLGAGPYRIVSYDGRKLLHLQEFSQPDVPTSDFKNLYFVHLPTNEALEAFDKRLVDDLFFYSIFPNDLPRLSNHSHIGAVYFPRSYVFTLNSRRLKDVSTRKQILEKIRPADLITKCYPSEKPTENLMPPGYEGHISKLELTPGSTSKSTKALTRPLKILVINSIGNETCVANELNNELGPYAKAYVGSLSSFVDVWSHNQIDAFFGYIEGETTITYFGSFSPTDDFPFGDVRDKYFARKFKVYQAAPDPATKNVLAQDLAVHILSRFTIKPIFHMKTSIVYQDRFDPLPALFSSAALTPLNYFKTKARLKGTSP